MVEFESAKFTSIVDVEAGDVVVDRTVELGELSGDPETRGEMTADGAVVGLPASVVADDSVFDLTDGATVDVVEVAVVDFVVVLVVVVGSATHTAYSDSPPAGIVMTWLFEYGVPVPADDVSQRDNVKPDRVKLLPLFRMTLAPEAAY